MAFGRPPPAALVDSRPPRALSSKENKTIPPTLQVEVVQHTQSEYYDLSTTTGIPQTGGERFPAAANLLQSLASPAETHPGACTAGSKGGPKVGTRLSEVVRSALPPPGRAQKPGRAFRASSQLSASRASGQVPSWTQRHGLHGQSQAGRRVTGFGASPQLDAESRASVTVPSWTQSPPGTARLGGGP